MNFKYFIIFIYSAFVVLIMVMVFKSCGEKIEMQTDDYYNKELAFQKEIDAKEKGNQFEDSIRIFDNGTHVIIKNRSGLNSDSVTLHFFKPDKASADKHLVFAGSELPPLDKKDFLPGIYKLSIRLYKDNEAYLIEKKLKL